MLLRVAQTLLAPWPGPQKASPSSCSLVPGPAPDCSPSSGFGKVTGQCADRVSFVQAQQVPKLWMFWGLEKVKGLVPARLYTNLSLTWENLCQTLETLHPRVRGLERCSEGLVLCSPKSSAGSGAVPWSGGRVARTRGSVPPPPQSFWSFTPSEEVRVKGGVRAGLGQKFTG